MIFEFRVEFRNDRITSTGYRHYTELQPVCSSYLAELDHVHSYQRRILLQLEYTDLQLSSCKIHRIGRSGSLKQFDNLSGSNLFRIKHQIDTHFGEQVLVFVRQIFFVIDPGCSLLASQFLGKHRADDIDILRVRRIHSNEKVSCCCPGILKSLDSGRIALHSHDISRSCKCFQPFLSFVYHGDVVGFIAEHLCQVRTYLTSSRYNDFHSLEIIKVLILDT